MAASGTIDAAILCGKLSLTWSIGGDRRIRTRSDLSLRGAVLCCMCYIQSSSLVRSEAKQSEAQEQRDERKLGYGFYCYER